MNVNRMYVLGVCIALMGCSLHAQTSIALEHVGTSADMTVLEHPITLTLVKVSVKHAIDMLAVQSGVRIQYRSVNLEAVRAPVTLRAIHMPLSVALDHVLSGSNLLATVVAHDMIIIEPSPGRSPEGLAGMITGHVIDASTKRPIAGAAIALDHATRDVQSAGDGTFRLSNVTPGTHMITVRSLGYVRMSQTVTVTDGVAASMTVALEPTTNTLDQVVVTGMVAATALKAVPNAMTIITGQELAQRGITQIDQLFHGDVPGVFAQNQGSQGVQPGQVRMTSRGATSFDGALTQPIKTYVDGVELADPSYLGLIDPKSIERIEILSGPQASTIYGSNAINGVMQIFTKRGTTSQPQVTANLVSGLIQNNFSPALAPHHDYGVQLAGMEGHVSYNTGGSWVYTGAWTSSIRTATTSGFGGVRLQQGAVVADVNLRRTLGMNWQNGVGGSGFVQGSTNGNFKLDATAAIARPNTYRSSAQTLGFTVTYAPVSWWSQTVTAGTDGTDAEAQQTRSLHTTPLDTLLRLSQTSTKRTSLAYTTTAQFPVISLVNAMITAGADGWHTVVTSLTASPTSLSGTLNSPDPTLPLTISRQPGHDHGAFVQGQVGMWDALFLTYGLRAEWNPNYGARANPNVVPRYGVAYTRSIGSFTAKLRASYGHATRPPVPGAGQEIPILSAYAPYYGPCCGFFANPELVPEQQQGGEGGAEIYFGNRGSLVITRYNQTVDNLIKSVVVDSLPLLPYWQTAFGCFPWNSSCTLYESKNLNVGSIRNQGWELQGAMNVGPFTTKGTYSWAMSRVIGVTPKYRAQDSRITVGASYPFVPEHRYAVHVQYARAGTSLALSVQGQGQSDLNGFSDAYVFSNLRFQTLQDRLRNNNVPRMTLPSNFVGKAPGYAKGDLVVSQRFSAHCDGVAQIQNVTNNFGYDNGSGNATMGRQTQIGLRVRF